MLQCCCSITTIHYVYHAFRTLLSVYFLVAPKKLCDFHNHMNLFNIWPERWHAFLEVHFRGKHASIKIRLCTILKTLLCVCVQQLSRKIGWIVSQDDCYTTMNKLNQPTTTTRGQSSLDLYNTFFANEKKSSGSFCACVHVCVRMCVCVCPSACG